MEIYGKYKALDYRRDRSRRQSAIINNSRWLGVPTSQENVYKQCHTEIKSDTRFVEIIQLQYTV